ncbi:MAG: hypothetical protein DMD26_05125 [Gemmatimonadetes bacterium]|nr:MAG: hypothetical protein DMD26_05125 [Gemmatimonadota bacterium]
MATTAYEQFSGRTCVVAAMGPRGLLSCPAMTPDASDQLVLPDAATAPPAATLIASVPSEPLLRPAPITKGDTIGVVAPSYSPRVGWLTRGVKALERAGYTVLLDPEITTLRRFTRAEDERRAENFMGMWLDPRVKALIGGTGGYGAVRMIPFLEPQIFESNPKAFVGYSDITALHLWLMRCAKLRVFHGWTTRSSSSRKPRIRCPSSTNDCCICAPRACFRVCGASYLDTSRSTDRKRMSSRTSCSISSPIWTCRY